MKLSFNTWGYSSYPSWLPAYPLEETIKRGWRRSDTTAWRSARGALMRFPETTTPERRKEISKVLEGWKDIALSSMLPAPSGNNVELRRPRNGSMR